MSDKQRPVSSGGAEDLVEPEGVNAGSSVPQDDEHVGAGDVQEGGNVDLADSPPAPPAATYEPLGPPPQEPHGSGQELAAGEG